MSQHRTTIRDVGRLAGVSVATVSKALNGTGAVSAETVLRVRDAAMELDYRPSRAAQGLVGRRSFQVGYRLPQLGAWGNPTLNAFLLAMVAAAGGHGLEIVLLGGDAGGVEAYEDLIGRGGVDGFVLSDTDYEDARVDYLVDRGFPFVTFGRTSRSERHFWVDVDGAAGTASVARHLVEVGHRDFAVIGWPEGSESGDLRVEGVRRVLSEHGIDDPLVVRTTNGVANGRAALAGILDGGVRPTAVIAVQDELAIGAVMEARSRGIEVGTDLAVAGFDDVPSATILEPALTSVRQPFDRIGAVLVDLLVEALSGAVDPRGELLVPELVVRESTTGVS